VKCGYTLEQLHINKEEVEVTMCRVIVGVDWLGESVGERDEMRSASATGSS
jgi:hypothetical protein